MLEYRTMKKKHAEVQRAKILTGLRKAKTSLEGVIDAIESEDSSRCFPVIQQNLAVIGLLKSANLLMLAGHMEQETAEWKGVSAAKRKAFQEEILRIVQTAQNK